MKLLTNVIGNTKGFMAIVALGIFALLMIFGLIVQTTVVDTYRNVKSSNNYLAARVVADSMMEALQFQLKDGGVGFNLVNEDGSKIVCEYSGGSRVDSEGGGISGLCQEFDWVATKDGVARDVKIVLEIKGRADEDENIATEKCLAFPTNFNTNCYVIPFPGTGDAGSRCNMYTPKFNSEAADDRTINGMDQLNYSCNWNKLTFGSSLTDRVAIPLYYSGDDPEVENSETNPYKDENGTATATQLSLRMRTPCLPCSYKEDRTSGTTTDTPKGYRECNKGDDPTVCTDTERYKLKGGTENEGQGKIVVQWQLSGKCPDINSGEEKDCSMIANPDPDLTVKSAIFEKRINESPDDNYKIIDNSTTGTNLSEHQGSTGASFLSGDGLHVPILPTFAKPVLNIFLSNALVSTDDKNVPYLEYQLLADSPLANPSTKMEVEVTVDGNTFKRTLYKEVRKELIDFAIQN